MSKKVSKPPIGVMPEVLWIEKRIQELTRAISEYVEHALNNSAMIDKKVAVWAYELSRLTNDYNKIGEETK